MMILYIILSDPGLFKYSVSDPGSLESGSGSSILAGSGSGSRLQKLIDSKGLKC